MNLYSNNPTEQQKKNRAYCEKKFKELMTLSQNIRNDIVRLLNREYLIIPFILGFMILSMVVVLAIKLG